MNRFPRGEWDEREYLELNRQTNRFIALANGRVEVLDRPTKSHQKRVAVLADALDEFFRHARIPGEVVLGAYPIRLEPGRFRQPDLVFAFDPARLGEDFGENQTWLPKWSAATGDAI
jgi:hypothetical protein